MKRAMTGVTVALLALLLGTMLVAACRADEDPIEAKQQAKEAWAKMRTDGERLVDQVQTKNDEGAKKQLLDQCRDAEERLRKDNNTRVDQAKTLCDKIRDTDVKDANSWNDIRNQVKDLNKEWR